MRRFSIFSFFVVIIALVCFILSLSQPHSVRDGYVLGYSAVRLSMAALLVIPAVFFSILSISALKQRDWVQKIINRLVEWDQSDRLVSLHEFAFLMAALGGYLIWKWGNLPDEKGVIMRLMPLLVFWTLFWAVGWIYAQFGIYHTRITFTEKLNLFADNSKKVLWGLLLIVLAAAILSIAGQLVRFYARTVYKLVEFVVYEFDLGGERNLPTCFNVFLLAAGSVLSLVIGYKHLRRREKFTANWIMVGCVFALLAYDDLEQVHESFTGPLKEFFHTSGLFTFAWVIPAIALVVLFAILNLRFFFNLPKRHQILLLAAAVVYVGGALGVEMIGGAYVEGHGIWNFNTILLANLEEVLELSGASLFVYFLLDYYKQDIA